MNIWFFHHYSTPDHLSGLHRPYEFGISLQKSGHSVTVFAASFLHYSGVNLIEDKTPYIVRTDKEVPYVYVRTPGYKNSGKDRMINMYLFYHRLFAVSKAYAKQNGKPDVIIASSPHPLTMIAGLRIAKKFKIPCICEIRDFWPEVFFCSGKLKESSIIGKCLLKGEKWIYKKADALVFLKEGDITYITDHHWDRQSGGSIDLSKCFYINNGVDFRAFTEKINAEKFDDPDLLSDAFKVVYCGSIRPVNQVDTFVAAANFLKDENILILIYGDGSCINDIQAQITKDNLANVKLKGYVQNKYIPYILSRSSVNVLHYSAADYNWSRGNSSNKLFEYMASGRPIISTVKMGYSLLEKYRCGITSDSNTPESIAEAIKKIKDMSEAEYSALCDNAKKAAQDFDFEVLTAKLTDVIGFVSDKHNK